MTGISALRPTVATTSTRSEATTAVDGTTTGFDELIEALLPNGRSAARPTTPGVDVDRGTDPATSLSDEVRQAGQVDHERQGSAADDGHRADAAAERPAAARRGHGAARGLLHRRPTDLADREPGAEDRVGTAGDDTTGSPEITDEGTRAERDEADRSPGDPTPTAATAAAAAAVDLVIALDPVADDATVTLDLAVGPSTGTDTASALGNLEAATSLAATTPSTTPALPASVPGSLAGSDADRTPTSTEGSAETVPAAAATTEGTPADGTPEAAVGTEETATAPAASAAGARAALATEQATADPSGRDDARGSSAEVAPAPATTSAPDAATAATDRTAPPAAEALRATATPAGAIAASAAAVAATTPPASTAPTSSTRTEASAAGTPDGSTIAAVAGAATTSSAAPTTSPSSSARPVAGPPVPVESVPVRIVSALRPLRGRDGSHSMSLDLDPLDLGRVRVDVTVERGVVHIALRAESGSTSRLLESQLSELRAALEDAGLTAGDLGVGADATGGRTAERDRADRSGADEPRGIATDPTATADGTRGVRRAADPLSALDLVL